MVGGEDLVVGDRFDAPAGLVSRCNSTIPRGRVAYSNRRCDRLGFVEYLTEHDRGCTGCLETPHFRPGPDFGVALPVCGDVPRVANGQGMYRRCGAEVRNNLEGRGLLRLDAVRIHGVHESYVEFIGEVAHDSKSIIEVPIDRDDRCAVRDCLGEFAGGDLARGKNNDAADPRPSCISRG